MIEDKELEKQFKADFIRYAGNPVELHLSFGDLWLIFSGLQLALRHPHNNNDKMMHIAKRMQHLLQATPALEKVAELGWEKH